MQTCLIDLRCLQDPNYSERGIGRHARALLSHAREYLPGMKLVGIADAAMTSPPGAIRSMVDAIRTTAYTGALSDPCCFVQLSPMTHDPLFVGRLLHHPAIPAATVVYDFIPLQNPGRYLDEPAARIEYFTALRWLARYDLFLPISQDAASNLKAALGTSSEQVTVTGAPLGPAFEALPRGRQRHVLVIAGADPRKNPECAIRAHARATSLQTSRTPICVTGAYNREWLAAQRDTIVQLGGDPSLLTAAGHVDERTLMGLYADALCVVAPSRAEGFSLPVIEAMAAGRIVLASDIPAHRELLSECLFDPDDDQALAALLDRLQDSNWSDAALRRQDAIWPGFRASAVAERFWTAVGRLSPVSSPSTVRTRPKVALLTPLPPDRSGVADYSAAACLELGREVDLHVYTPTVDPELPIGARTVSHLSLFPFVSSSFDRVVTVLGNSVFHLDILRLLLRFGGASILHDGRMLDLYAGHMGFEKTVRMAETELSRPLRSNEIWSWLNSDVPPEALILSEVAAAAEPLMMHSRAGLAEVNERYAANALHLPFSLYRGIAASALAPAKRQAARERLGIRDKELLIVTIGYVHPTKAPLDCLWALILLRSWGLDASLHYVGSSMMPMDGLERIISDHGLDKHVRLPGDFVDEGTYRDYLVGADAAIQLRYGAVGSVSGALSDCIASGLRTVASESLASAVDAPAYVRSVCDNTSPVIVAEAVLALLTRPDTAEERQAYVSGHGFDVYTRALSEALALS